MVLSIAAVSLGASLGALLRWCLGEKLNSLYPLVPAGTLLANLIGGYIIGAALAVFSHSPEFRPEWKLFLITGFCGGLTTFSTFSAEVVQLIQENRPGWALGAIAVHVLGSLLMTFAGLFSVRWIQGT